MYKNSYWLWNSILSKEFCEQQIKEIDWSKKADGEVLSKNGYVVDKEKRVTDVVWLNENSPLGCIAQVYTNMANEKAGWNFLLTNAIEVQIGKYEAQQNGFYDWHTDSGFETDEYGLVNKLSVVMLLSDEKEFEGGLFEFRGFEKQPELKQGSLIVFPSYLEHRVTPVTKGTRISAVTWVNGPAYR